MSWFKIFSAVVVGNLVSWILISIIGLFFWIAVMDATTEALFGSLDPKTRSTQPPSVTTQPTASSKNQVTIGTVNSEVTQSARPERNKTDPSVIRTNRQMCEFWTAEYRNDGLEQSRKYRDAACARYRGSLNN